MAEPGPLGRLRTRHEIQKGTEMPYVTQDRRVLDLIEDVKANRISRETFTESVKALGFLNWEVHEAAAEAGLVLVGPLDAG